MTPPAEPHDHHRAERAAALVLTITVVTMAAEIVGGWWTRSMALTADGWHMGMHAAAMGIAVLAYRFARHHRTSGRYSFGAGKAVDLGGFANAVMLAVVALLIGFESAERLLRPEAIDFTPALTVAGIGLAVNLLSAWLLRDDHDHGHDHHHDHNREAAFVHVLADAVTSALALAALFGGKHFGLVWLDPLVGLIGAGVILSWALALARRTAAVLLDAAPKPAVLEAARAIVAETGGDLIDLRAWPIAAGRFVVALRLAGGGDCAGRLLALPGIVEVLVERRAADLHDAPRDRPRHHHH